MEPTAPSVGARVKLHSLQQKPEHNGVEGEVLEFDASAGRWKVQLHPDGPVLALKASNLAVMAPAELCPEDEESEDVLAQAHGRLKSLIQELQHQLSQTDTHTQPQRPAPSRAARRHGPAMAAGINYSKWDSLEVSDSEDEEEATSKAALVQQHCEIEQTAAAQRKLRELIDEHNSGKPLEPPEEVRDILEEPLWCDEPRDAAAPANAARERAHAQRAGGDTTPARSRQDGGTAVQALAGAPGSMQQARTGRKRRDFADWDKLKLDDSESDEKRVVAAARPRAAPEHLPAPEIEKMRQLMQLQEGLSKMRKDREQRQQ